MEEREEEKGGGIGRQCMRRVGMRGGGGSEEEFLRVGTGSSSRAPTVPKVTLTDKACLPNE